MKQVTFTLFTLLISCAIVFSANAATGQTDSLPINSGIVILLAVALGLGIKVVSKKLKQVDKDLHDAFGEKVL
ncbi:hypothetical protein KXQ82_17255 [Mucilaginibacter sp. HMF5004]|uniref:hypothetical protein n=1 Tax=Mucilaginibacter rivuli TaxID=2857527 RepID=UPI001C6043DC|nr:hypothetical protein [Mucilaginibacter rivuli]MBW4891479.1 hypothetical protein [Mucilaginibacter rivuli]